MTDAEKLRELVDFRNEISLEIASLRRATKKRFPSCGDWLLYAAIVLLLLLMFVAAQHRGCVTETPAAPVTHVESLDENTGEFEEQKEEESQPEPIRRRGRMFRRW